MWPLSSPTKLDARGLNFKRLSRRSRRRFRPYLQLETLEDRQLLSGPTVSFIKADTATQGNWIGTYGSQGYDVIGNAASLPSYATVTPAGQSSSTWAAASTDPRALQDASGSGRIAAYWYSPSSFNIDVNLSDGQTHDLELYFLDWYTTTRSEQVQFSSASSGAVLNTETVNSFNSGVYLDWAVSGNVVITFTHLAGINAVLSGLFLDPTTPTASFINQYTATQGNWIGTYGSQGYDVIGDAASLPSYATVTPAGQTSYTWTASSTDPRALQDAGGSGRIAACWYAPSSFTIDVNLTDGQTHDLELYFLDWDTTARSEKVQISNASTGGVLNTETVTSFHSGVYLDWAVSGNVVITVSHLAGINAVLSGLFLDATPTASFIKQYTATQGNWIGTYGSQGYDVIGDAASLPSYATLTPAGQTSYTWTASSTDPRALRNASGSGRIAACWYSPSSFTIDVNLTDGQTHDLELYFLDWDTTTRSEKVQISNASTGAVLDTETVTSFHSGVYMNWVVSGNVDITITHLAGANAVLSGLFFDPTPTASFIKQDTTTQGNWIATYGSQGYDVIGNAASLPSYVTVTPAGQTNYTWTASSTDPRALRNASGSGRIAACWYSPSSFTIDVNLTDGQSHDLELYFLDWDTTTRGEKVQISNASTGAVLDTETVTSFHSGVYMNWVVSGNVDITITHLAGANAVLSGLFFDPPTRGSGKPVINAGSSLTVNAESSLTFSQATETGGTAPFIYSWNFDDGTTQSGSLNPSHTYPNPGSYTASVTVTDANKLTSSSWVVVTVNDVAPTVTLNDPQATVGVAVNFTASATDVSPAVRAAGFTYAWNFGDGGTGSGATVSHTYATSGTYTVSVTATDEYGGVSKAATSKLTVISATLTANAGKAINTNAGTSITIAGSVSGGTAPYTEYWNFGDGTTTIGTLTPSHTYGNNGTYTALLDVVDAKGNTASSTVTVTVAGVAPTASISGPPSGDVGSAVTFVGSATDPSAADFFAGFTYNWNFGDGTTGTGQTPSHTYTSPGTYTVSATATDENKQTSVRAITIITITAATVIPINQTWLQNNGPAPYVLSQAGATYQLETNVTTSGTAFVILNQNITLDLNGYKVTYGNSSPITVTNGGFEQGSGTHVPGWNLSAAPSAAIAPNNSYLFGNQVLQLSNFSTTQTIVSSPTSGLVAGHTYTSTITPAGVNSNSSVILNVIDAVTGATLGSAASANVQRGVSAVVTFTPTTTDPVKLQVVVTPTTTPDTLDLDQATLTPSFDYGIVASGAWGNLPGGGDFGPGYQNLGAAVQAIWNPDRTSVTNITIENGSIVQGQAAGYSSSPIYGEYGYGITLNSLHTSDSGVDTTSIDLNKLTGGGATITNSTFTQTGNNVTDRMAGPATIDLQLTSTSPILIQGNTLTGCLQTGIGIDTSNGPIIINNNHISQNTVVPDAAGIGLVAVSNFQVTNNTITPIAGEGIAIDGYRAQGSDMGVIQNNTVITKDVPNREVGLGTQARALRLRNDVDSEGPQTNIDISGNTFTTTIGPGMSNVGYTVWVTYVNNNGAMNNANINLRNNTITLINDSSDPSYSGSALLVDGMDPGINMTISNNILASNDTSLSIGGYNDANVNDLTFLSNTLSKSSSGAARTYTGISAGFDVTQISNVQIIDTKLANGATSTIVWSGSGTKDIEVGWLLNVTVENAGGSAASDAAVQLFNSSNSLVYAGVANANGVLSGIMVLSTMYQQTGSDSTQITTTNWGPFSVTATNGSKKGSASVSLTGDQNLTIVVD